MKNIIAILLVILGTSRAMALSVIEVSCTDGQGQSIYLARDADDTLRGVLHDSFYMADIECDRGGWGPLTYQSDIKCYGVWNADTDQNRPPVVVDMHMQREWPRPIGIAKYLSRVGEVGHYPVSLPVELKCDLGLN